VAVLEVAHAAVHQPRRPARRAGGEVVALDERHAQPARRRVARHPGAGHAAADDEQIEHPVGERAQAPGGGIGRRARARGRRGGRGGGGEHGGRTTAPPRGNAAVSTIWRACNGPVAPLQRRRARA
jgi:hypothetical protein